MSGRPGTTDDGQNVGCSRVRCSETGEVYVITVSSVGTFECPGCNRQWRVA